MIPALLLVLSAATAAADFSVYRGFAFGSEIAAVAKQANVPLSEARVIHPRPSLLQEIDWRVAAPVASPAARPDPVQDALLCFLDGKLYRIVVTYDRYRIEGMSAQDMIDVISLTYGPATYPKVEIPFRSNYADTAKVLARWQNAAYAYDLVRTGDQASFVLILYSKPDAALAQSAATAAARLEALDAPRQARELERKRAETERLALEAIRAVNKPNFRP